MMNTNIWIVSDTHFGHLFLKQAGYRPDDYESRILESWSKIDENDTVIHLGDVSFTSNTETGQMLEMLPGFKVLVRGNHDGGYGRHYEQGFNLVTDQIRMNHYGFNLVFSHEPIKGDGPNFANIHGHLHGDDHRLQDDLEWYRNRESWRYIDMSADCWNFELKNLKSIISLIKKRRYGN